MQIKVFRVFCDVVREHSFSKAAVAHGLSQSAASQMVHQLEEKLGVQLVDRAKRPWVLTAEGEFVYRECRKIVKQWDGLMNDVSQLDAHVTGSVRVAAIYSVGFSHMKRHVTEFESSYPDATIKLKYEHPDRVYELVESDIVELGLVSFAKTSRSINVIPWRNEPFVVACAPDHPLAKRRRISVAQLNDLPMISFDKNLKIRREIDHALARRQIQSNTVMDFDNTETIKRTVELNSGVAILPEPTIAREIQQNTLVAVPLLCDESDEPLLHRPLSIIHRRKDKLSTQASRFVAQLQQLDQPVGKPKSKAGSNGSGRNGASKNGASKSRRVKKPPAKSA